MSFRIDETPYEFRTARFVVRLEIEFQDGYQYDGDDEDGETQAALDSGEFVAFDSRAAVYLDEKLIAADYLGSSVYGADEVDSFVTAHRDPDPMNRNCTLMRAARGQNVCICHYFPDMIRQAVDAARYRVRSMPKVRGVPEIRVA